jgi:predicted unusual protein kinase regulating ubiquinone biosynthesis (AarF/ABC1/UbiB family)
VDRRVINSGMIALVFKGVDASGQPIVVKLKRRNILQHLQEGCTVVSTVYSYAAYWVPKNLYVRILRPFILNIHEIIDQCDFSTEIANLKQAKEDFEPLSFIQIPAVYNRPILTPPEYILMEHIDGTHVLPPNTTEQERINYLEKFATFVSYGFLFNAIQHTDLHSGNVLFTKTGLGIIDYGMAIQLNDDTHDMLLSTAAIIRDRPPLHTIDFIDTFKELFVPRLVKEELVDPAAVEDMCISIAHPLIENIDFDELNVTDSLAKLSTLLGREVTLHRDIYKIILGFSMMAGKNMIFGPNYADTEQIHDIERRGLRNAYALII